MLVADVPTNGSPTPCRSKNPPKSTSSSDSRTSGYKPQNTSNIQPILDETVDQILVRVGSPLGEGEVREAVETLEKVLQSQRQTGLRTRAECFQGLVKICREYGTLPGSYIIPGSKVQKVGYTPISSGSSGVWEGAYEGKAVAIKVIQRDKSEDIQEIKANFCREVATWKSLSHTNVLELIGVTMDDEEYTMVMPWMANGTIVEFLRENLQANPLKLLGGASRGLQYLHGMDLAHCDLKGGNILVSDDGQACLADIGLTRIAGDLGSTVTASSQTVSSDGANTRRWCPPELLDPERFESTRVGPTKKADIYSMAMTIYEVLTDRIPFYEHNDCMAIISILEGVRPKAPIFVATRGYTEELWEMTTSCWKEDPSERPTVDYVLAALSSAAEQWKPKHGALLALPLQGDWSPTLTENVDPPTLPEHENEPVAITTPPSPIPSQPPVIETRVPASVRLATTPTPSVLARVRRMWKSRQPSKKSSGDRRAASPNLVDKKAESSIQRSGDRD